MVDVGKVLVVGGGICGMSCAIQLANSGLQIDLIDLDPQWRVYGAGITITGPTFRALKEIGLIGEVIEKGFACDGAKTRTRDGALIAEVNMPGLAAGIPYGGGIMRPVLHEILARATKGAGVAVRLGLTIDHVADLGSSVDVVFSDGTADSYGLVVGADGINSKMRQLLFPDAPEPHFTGQGAWRVLAPRPPAVDMIETFLSPGIKAGVTPISDKQLYMFALSPETEDVIPPEDQAGRLKEVLEGFGGLIGDIRDHLGPESSIVYRPLKTVMMPAPWYRGRVVLVGDAVHATTPHLASGAGCAVEDAVVLAMELQARDRVEAALAAFMERRFERCHQIVKRSVDLGRMELAGAPGEEQARAYSEANDLLVMPI